jgi:hypothetical protein
MNERRWSSQADCHVGGFRPRVASAVICRSDISRMVPSGYMIIISGYLTECLTVFPDSFNDKLGFERSVRSQVHGKDASVKI